MNRSQGEPAERKLDPRYLVTLPPAVDSHRWLFNERESFVADHPPQSGGQIELVQLGAGAGRREGVDVKALAAVVEVRRPGIFLEPSDFEGTNNFAGRRFEDGDRGLRHVCVANDGTRLVSFAA